MIRYPLQGPWRSRAVPSSGTHAERGLGNRDDHPSGGTGSHGRLFDEMARSRGDGGSTDEAAERQRKVAREQLRARRPRLPAEFSGDRWGGPIDESRIHRLEKVFLVVGWTRQCFTDHRTWARRRGVVIDEIRPTDRLRNDEGHRQRRGQIARIGGDPLDRGHDQEHASHRRSDVPSLAHGNTRAGERGRFLPSDRGSLEMIGYSLCGGLAGSRILVNPVLDRGNPERRPSAPTALRPCLHRR